MTVPGAAEIASIVADRLDEAGLPHALGGALALGAWGVPRTTLDVDLAVFIGADELDRLIDALERAGCMVDRDEATRSARSAGFLVVRCRGVRVDLFLSHHPLHAAMERRRVALRTPDGRTRTFLSAEDVVITKLIYHRTKDIADLERLFAVQAGSLDLAYVRDWLARIAPAGDPRHALLEDLAARFP